MIFARPFSRWWVLLLSLCAAPALADGDPQALVERTARQMLDKLQEERATLEADPGRLYELVNRIVLPHFDFQRMARWVLGKHWRRADTAQRERFVAEFRTLLVRTYASALAEYKDQRLDYLPMRGDPAGGEVTVRSQIEPPGGLPIPVDYNLYRDEAGAWKVYDVSVDGLSLVTNYRSSFANEIRGRGVEGLIATLEKRNRGASE